MRDEESWTLQKKGRRLEFIDRGHVIFIKVWSKDEPSQWEPPQPKAKARQYWDSLVKQGYRLV